MNNHVLPQALLPGPPFSFWGGVHSHLFTAPPRGPMIRHPETVSGSAEGVFMEKQRLLCERLAAKRLQSHGFHILGAFRFV